MTGEAAMDALEMTLLYDFYGGMLTEKQRECFDMRYNQDLSLGEIAQALGVSRQAVCDNLARTEALLRRMEENSAAWAEACGQEKRFPPCGRRRPDWPGIPIPPFPHWPGRLHRPPMILRSKQWHLKA